MQAVIRSVCAIIDAFHFPTVAEAALTSAEGGADVSADAAEIQTALTKRVLPALQTHLVGQLFHSVISTCLRGCCSSHSASFIRSCKTLVGKVEDRLC